MLVFEKQLEKLQVKVGDAITISAQTTRGVSNTIDVRVVAIAKDVGLMSMWNVYVPGETLRTLYQLRDRRHRRAAHPPEGGQGRTTSARWPPGCASRWRRPATG